MDKKFKVSYINAFNDVKDTTVIAKNKERAASIVSDLPLCGQIISIEDLMTEQTYSSAEEIADILALAQLGLHKEVAERLLHACKIVTHIVPYSYISVVNLVKQHVAFLGDIPQGAKENDKLMQDFVYEIVHTHQMKGSIYDYEPTIK